MSNSINPVVCADNCQACGIEHLNIELIPVKLGNYALARVCLGCLANANKADNDIYGDYKKSAELIMQALKKHV